MFPINKPSFSEAFDDFNKLKNNSFKDLITKGKWETKDKYKYDLTSTYIKTDNIGLMSSDYFHFDTRMCEGNGVSSPIVRKFSGIQSSSNYVAEQFRPSAFKSILQKFKAKKVLDYNLGFGDRFSAVLATGEVKHYTGFSGKDYMFLDLETQSGLRNSISRKLHLTGYSETELESKYYDLIFLESSFEEKPDELKMIWESLEDKGNLCIYMSNTYNKVQDKMCDFISTLNGAKYRGCIGYQIKTPKGFDGIYCNPMWFFTKNL